MRFYEATDGWNEPTIWYGPQPVIQRCQIPPGVREHVWPELVRALTAGPTMESARVVVDVLREEIAALTAANRDLNDELTSLRRELGR